jgi:hypothetical protein
VTGRYPQRRGASRLIARRFRGPEGDLAHSGATPPPRAPSFKRDNETLPGAGRHLRALKERNELMAHLTFRTSSATDPTAVAGGPAVDSEPALPTAAVPTAGAPIPPDAAEPGDEVLDPPTFQLSVTQLLATAAAAVTAAVLGSRLGVAGTLIGAALASSVSMIAAAVYSHSLATAAYRVKVARVHTEAAADLLPAASRAWGQVPPAPAPGGAPPVAPTASREPLGSPRPGRSRWWAAGLGVVAACALALLTVTGIEAVRGSPLSGGTAGGLSVLGGASVGTPDTSPTTGRSSDESAEVTPPDGPAAPAGDTDTDTDTTAESSPAPDTSETAPATVTSTVTVSPTAPSTAASPATPPATGASTAGSPPTSTPAPGGPTTRSTTTTRVPATTDGASTPDTTPQTAAPTSEATAAPAGERGVAGD